jgi:hypothetical protein
MCRKELYVLSDPASDVPKTELKERWKRIAHLGWNRVSPGGKLKFNSRVSVEYMP